MNKHITKKTDIESTKALMSYSNDKQIIFNNICKANQLTEEFIKEFPQYMTLENFSTSYRLERSIVDTFPEYFSESTFLNNIDSYYKTVKAEEQAQTNQSSISGMMNFSQIDDSTRNLQVMPISISMLADYKDEIKKFDSVDEDDIKNMALKSIREAFPEEFDSEAVLGLIGISDEIDRTIMLCVKDPTIKNSLLLVLSMNEGMNVSTEVSSNYTDEMKDNLLGTNCSAKEFLTALSSSKSQIWQKKKIEEVLSGELELEHSDEQLDTLLSGYLTKVPEDMVCDIFKLRSYMPNAFSLKTLQYVLQYKKLSEDQLISLLDAFIQAGAILTLKKYASNNEYEKLSEAIRRKFGN